MSFRAFQVLSKGAAGSIQTLSKKDLPAGDVLIRVEWSSLNYKDALGGLARGKIFKKFPIIAGIDLAGEIVQSDTSDFRAGQKVLVHGCGLGESSDGGYAEWARVPKEWVVPLPVGMGTRQSMFFGTAGFTAALALHRMLVAGQSPDKGPLVVTGASGGVGMIATALASHLGFEVWAMTGKKQLAPLLTEIGAQRVISESDLNLGDRPLESVQIGGAIDNIGGATLGKLLACTQLWGNVASVGLAAGDSFSATVMPFILRGVCLLGVSSANTPQPLRKLLWEKLASEWRAPGLDSIPVQEVELDGVALAMESILARKHTGRTLVKI